MWSSASIWGKCVMCELLSSSILWHSPPALVLSCQMKPDLKNSMFALGSHWRLVDWTITCYFPAADIQPPSPPSGEKRKLDPVFSLPCTFSLDELRWSHHGQHHSKTSPIRTDWKNFPLFFVIMGVQEEEKPRPPSDITVFGANCTLHGLSHIFLPGGVTLRRLLWAAAFSASLSIFLYQVADRVIEYYQYPHVTILDEMDSPVMYFPAITLCNYNSFRKSQIRRNDIFWMAGLLGVEQGDFDEFMAAVGQPTDNSKFFPSKTFNMLEFVQRTSHSIEDMLLDCKYRGKDCGPENFTTVSTLSAFILKWRTNWENCKRKELQEQKKHLFAKKANLFY